LILKSSKKQIPEVLFLLKNEFVLFDAIIRKRYSELSFLLRFCLYAQLGFSGFLTALLLPYSFYCSDFFVKTQEQFRLRFNGFGGLAWLQFASATGFQNRFNNMISTDDGLHLPIYFMFLWTEQLDCFH
jgi:hypothetical protein